MQQMVFCQFAMEVMVLMLMLRSSFVMKVMVLDIAMSFVRPCRSTQIHAYHRYPNLEGVLYKLICCEKTCTRKKRKLAQDRKHHPDLG